MWRQCFASSSAHWPVHANWSPNLLSCSGAPSVQCLAIWSTFSDAGRQCWCRLDRLTLAPTDDGHFRIGSVPLESMLPPTRIRKLCKPKNGLIVIDVHLPVYNTFAYLSPIVNTSFATIAVANAPCRGRTFYRRLRESSPTKCFHSDTKMRRPTRSNSQLLAHKRTGKQKKNPFIIGHHFQPIGFLPYLRITFDNRPKQLLIQITE